MKKSVIIRCVKRNIEKYGSLFSDKLTTCALCDVAGKRFNPNNSHHYGRCRCVACPLWDYISTSDNSCGWIRYKGKPLISIDSELEGNKPALRALLNGVINLFEKGGLNK